MNIEKNIARIRILIADDHTFVRAGIKAVLSDIPDLQIIGEAENGVDAVLKSKELSPDVIIMDALMPFLSGIDATGIIKNKNPEMTILVITPDENEELVFEALRNGASGVLYINTEKDELVKAIKTVFRGNKYIGENLANFIIDRIKFKRHYGLSSSSPVGGMLTKRERQILVHVAEGLSNSEIAKELQISPHTVDAHKTNLIKKLNLSNSNALRKFAIENKFIKP